MKTVILGVLGGALAIGALFGWSYIDKYRKADVYESLGEGLAESLLRDAVLDIESYKLIFGFYPETIAELRGDVTHIDPAADECECPGDFYYQPTDNGNGYHLFSISRDCEAYTADDIHPKLTMKEKQSIGLKNPVSPTLGSHNDGSA